MRPSPTAGRLAMLAVVAGPTPVVPPALWSSCCWMQRGALATRNASTNFSARFLVLKTYTVLAMDVVPRADPGSKNWGERPTLACRRASAAADRCFLHPETPLNSVVEPPGCDLLIHPPGTSAAVTLPAATTFLSEPFCSAGAAADAEGEGRSAVAIDAAHRTQMMRRMPGLL